LADVLQLLFVLVVILVVAEGSGAISSAVNQRAGLGELLAGVILDPTVIDLYERGNRTLIALPIARIVGLREL
jgi:Kef-type K+ transport system membrane component KefB